MAVHEPPVGARVVLGGKHRATVRYVGPIHGQRGTWVGIEYDEAGRGKHDGSHEGTRYFSGSYDPTAGSFVRLSKFLEAADLGRSLAAAAADRYGLAPAPAAATPAGQPASQEQEAEAQQELYVSTAGNRRVTVELVGSDAGGRPTGAGAAVAVLTGQRISSVVS